MRVPWRKKEWVLEVLYFLVGSCYTFFLTCVTIRTNFLNVLQFVWYGIPSTANFCHQCLFLARRTEFAFCSGHFLNILLFHSLLATFQVSISLIFDLFWSHCFGWNRSKVVWGSKVRNTFMHGPSFFSFHFLSFSISFPKLAVFTILRLYMACNMWEISSWRLAEQFHISAFHMYYSLYKWIGEHEITKLKRKICFESRKKDTKTSTKRHEMEWYKMDYLIFSAMCIRKRHLFCTSSHHNLSCEKRQDVDKGCEPWNECPC